MLKAVIIIMALLSSQVSYATSPCQLPTKEWLISSISNSSNIVYAKIINMSTRDHNNPGESRDDYWTDINIIGFIYGSLKKRTLRIVAWQAYSYPTFIYKKGQKAIFILSKNNDKYELTDASWMYCAPSIIEENDNGKFVLQYIDDHLYVNEQMSLSAINKNILNFFPQ